MKSTGHCAFEQKFIKLCTYTVAPSFQGLLTSNINDQLHKRTDVEIIAPPRKLVQWIITPSYSKLPAKNIKVELVENVVQVETHVGEYTKLVADLKDEVGTCRYYAFLSNLGLFTHNSLVSHTSTVCHTHCPELSVIFTAVVYNFIQNAAIRLLDYKPTWLQL